jgi:hypothetical protein
MDLQRSEIVGKPVAKGFASDTCATVIPGPSATVIPGPSATVIPGRATVIPGCARKARPSSLVSATVIPGGRGKNAAANHSPSKKARPSSLVVAGLKSLRSPNLGW